MWFGSDRVAKYDAKRDLCSDLDGYLNKLFQQTKLSKMSDDESRLARQPVY